jgi:hypothetical protein
MPHSSLVYYIHPHLRSSQEQAEPSSTPFFPTMCNRSSHAKRTANHKSRQLAANSTVGVTVFVARLRFSGFHPPVIRESPNGFLILAPAQGTEEAQVKIRQ